MCNMFVLLQADLALFCVCFLAIWPKFSKKKKKKLKEKFMLILMSLKIITKTF